MTENNNPNYVDYTNKVNIEEFKLDPVSKHSNIKGSRGNRVSGLIKIVMKGRDSNGEYQEEYIINFKGNMKIINNISETEKAIREHYNQASKEWMRRKREKTYKNQIKEYFPKKELEDNLENLSEKDKSWIPARKIKDMIYTILKENNILANDKDKIAYNSQIWQSAVDKFMFERGYLKKEGIYVKKRIDNR